MDIKLYLPATEWKWNKGEYNHSGFIIFAGCPYWAGVWRTSTFHFYGLSGLDYVWIFWENDPWKYKKPTAHRQSPGSAVFHTRCLMQRRTHTKVYIVHLVPRKQTWTFWSGGKIRGYHCDTFTRNFTAGFLRISVPLIVEVLKIWQGSSKWMCKVLKLSFHTASFVVQFTEDKYFTS